MSAKSLQSERAAPQPAQAHEGAEVDALGAYGNGFMADQLLGGGLGAASLLPGLEWLFEGPEERAAREQAEFISTCWPDATDFDTGTGGRFDVRLCGSAVFVTLRVAYEFLPGDPGRTPPGTPSAELAWSTAQEQQFRDDFSRTITGSWSGAHPIQSTRPGWSLRLPVLVTVVEDSSDPHFRLRVSKTPDDVPQGGARVCPPGWHPGVGCEPAPPGDPSGGTDLDSRDNALERVRNGSQGVDTVWFDRDSSAVDATGQTTLSGPASLLAAHSDWTVELRGHASSDGPDEANFQLARDRNEAVATELVGSGADAGQIMKTNASESEGVRGPAGRRVDVQVIDVQSQRTAAHEAGHMFGLADEYLYAGEGAGTAFPPEYQQLIRDNATVSGGLPTKGPADSIMSNGMQVENWHYAPFVAAVKQITGSDEWTV